MSPLRDCTAMFTLLLLSCLGGAAAGPLWESQLSRRCEGTDCNIFASPIAQHSSPEMSTISESAVLHHRSSSSISELRSGTTNSVKLLRGLHHAKRGGNKRSKVSTTPSSVLTHNIFHGEASTGGYHQTPSTADVFSDRRLSDMLETYYSRKEIETHRAKDISNEATSILPVYSSLALRSSGEKLVYKDVLLNKPHTDAGVNGRRWSERPSYRSNPKHNRQTPAHMSHVSKPKSSESYNRQSGGVLRSRFWKVHNSVSSTEEVVKIVNTQTVTLTTVSDDVVSLGRSATSTQQQANSESLHASARKSGFTPHSAYVPSFAQNTVSPPHSDRSSADEHEADTSEKEIPDSDLQEQQEQLEDAIARDATLIIVFSCLAVASLVMWRVVRCIALHKLKQHEKRLAEGKASTV